VTPDDALARFLRSCADAPAKGEADAAARALLLALAEKGERAEGEHAAGPVPELETQKT
jgi:hypothetical protein